PQFAALLRVRELRFEKAELRSAVEAPAFDEAREHPLALHQRAYRRRQRSAFRESRLIERLPQRRREYEAPCRDERNGGRADRRHLDERARVADAARTQIRADQVLGAGSRMRRALRADDADPLLFVNVE